VQVWTIPLPAKSIIIVLLEGFSRVSQWKSEAHTSSLDELRGGSNQQKRTAP